jgi:tRNA pseudouridine55 synthase
MFNGIILVDKPQGITSHDLVDRLRVIFDQRRVGHTGILDPLATGLMVMLLGKGTLFSPQLTGADKRYKAEIRFGRSTDTFDAEGKTTGEKDPGDLSIEEFEELCNKYSGKIKQLIPPFSAAKFDGQKMYESARKGEITPERFKEVEFYSVEISSFSWPDVGLEIRCSAGTYVRSLAHEMGQMVGCGAYLTNLIRTGVGSFKLEHAVTLRDLEKAIEVNDCSMIKPLWEAMPEKPRIFVRPEYIKSIIEGRPFIKKYLSRTEYRGPGGCLSLLVDTDSRVVALAHLNYSWGSFDRLDSRDVLGKYVRIIDEGHLRQEHA